MKAIFITYNQAFNEEIVSILESFGQRGFTRWTDVQGRGSVDGTPHMGNHAWPEMNHVMISFIDESIYAPLVKKLKETDAETPALGLRVYGWDAEEAV
ncbi:MAG: hypothetical protein J5764_00110 [Bacteroidales bacterium]|nr:hypothetical protein [Bacteroidales bacterium]